MNPKFVHLRVHSEFSLTDGLVRVGPLMKSVAAADMPSVAVTDRNNFFGLIKAYKAAEREGVKLIIGADFEVLEDDELGHAAREAMAAERARLAALQGSSLLGIALPLTYMNAGLMPLTLFKHTGPLVMMLQKMVTPHPNASP